MIDSMTLSTDTDGTMSTFATLPQHFAALSQHAPLSPHASNFHNTFGTRLVRLTRRFKGPLSGVILIFTMFSTFCVFDGVPRRGRW